MIPVPPPDPEPGGEQPPLPGDGGPDRTRDGGAGPAKARADAMLPGGPAGMDAVPGGAEDGDADDYLSWFLATLTRPGGADGSGFGRDEIAAQLSPGPLLYALAEQAAADPASLTGHELLAMVASARRLAARAEYLELAAVAEFACRARAACEESAAVGARPGRRLGEFAVTELAMELLTSDNAAADRMDFAVALATRLPKTAAGLAAGTVDGGKAWAIWYYTRFLSDADAAEADAILAAAAPGLRYESLARKAAKLEMKLDPASVKARKEHARKDGRRVEVRREVSGNMSFGGRELGVEEALAAKVYNDADATALRQAGMPGTLRELRVLAMLDRIAGRNPLDRIAVVNGGDVAAHGGDLAARSGDVAAHDSDSTDRVHPDGTADHYGPRGGHARDVLPGNPGDQDDDEAGGEADSMPASGAPGSPAPAPVPALINLQVPVGTLLGWSTTPGDAWTWGLLDAEDTRSIVQAASQHPATRWCVTMVNPDGTAAAHGCARGPHGWTPAPGSGGATARPRANGPPAGPDEHQRAQLAQLLRALNVTLSPIARGTCDHRHREDRYTPSRRLKHLLRARTATCIGPGCGAQAAYCDLDHTVAYPGGPTCECNFGLPCRRHHRVKQAPGWHLEQPEPGVMRWTTPSGRIHVTTPTKYDL